MLMGNGKVDVLIVGVMMNSDVEGSWMASKLVPESCVSSIVFQVADASTLSRCFASFGFSDLYTKL